MEIITGIVAGVILDKILSKPKKYKIQIVKVQPEPKKEEQPNASYV